MDEITSQGDVLARRNGELFKVDADIRRLSGLLLVCSQRKKVRNDEGYWKQIEEYFLENSDLLFSPGLCPECTKEICPDLAGD